MDTAIPTSTSTLVSFPSVTQGSLESTTQIPVLASSAPNANSVVAFIIGLTIILLASILNAAGLNLTKLDHVRTSVIPKISRKKDWQRPLWLLGMLLYILSQLIGSTLALEYMRAEYVAPLGSASLIFNFLFARFLVGTPVTSTDIYGTIIVVLGVVGIVAFGSINGGLASETDVEHITHLWRRGGWLGFFFAMTFALILLLVFTAALDDILAARSELNSVPFVATGGNSNGRDIDRRSGGLGLRRALEATGRCWSILRARIMEWLEIWTAAKSDKQIAWTLGIGWACCGGGLAGGCLVFAKATVKLISGSLSHQNPGNQFGHAAPIFTILLLVVTAVLQIICLNHGLKVYDSTLVVPVFYGVYTATGFLDSLIFNNEVDSYHSWTLFLIFVSILILISGVVLLTHKKPEPASKVSSATLPRPKRKGRKTKKDPGGGKLVVVGEESEVGNNEVDADEGQVLWAVGDGDDDDGSDDEYGSDGIQNKSAHRGPNGPNITQEGEGSGLMDEHEIPDNRGRTLTSAGVIPVDPFRDDPEEFGRWEGGRTRSEALKAQQT